MKCGSPTQPPILSGDIWDSVPGNGEQPAREGMKAAISNLPDDPINANSILPLKSEETATKRP